ncbi:MAG: hypothetical protein WAR22_14875 [Desulfomonilia bacterium]
MGNISRCFKGIQLYPENECWMIEEFKYIKREEERSIKGYLQERPGDRLGVYLICPEDKEKNPEAAKFREARAGGPWRRNT